MRHQDDVVHAREGRFRLQRLALEHVEARARDRAPVERRDQRLLVDDGAARGVDQVGRRLHRRQLRLADEVARLRVEGRVHGDVVGAAQQLVQRLHALDAVGAEHALAEVGVVRDHVQAERLGARDDRPRDVAQRHQPQRLAADGSHRAERAGPPAAVAHGRIEQRQLLRAGEQQEHRLVGHLGLAEVGEVRDHDAVVRGRGDVERVQPHAVADDELALRHRLDHAPRDLGGGDEDRVRVLHVRDQLVLAGGAGGGEGPASGLDDALLDLEGDVGALVDVDDQVRFRHGRKRTDAAARGPAGGAYAPGRARVSCAPTRHAPKEPP